MKRYLRPSFVLKTAFSTHCSSCSDSLSSLPFLPFITFILLFSHCCQITISLLAATAPPFSAQWFLPPSENDSIWSSCSHERDKTILYPRTNLEQKEEEGGKNLARCHCCKNGKKKRGFYGKLVLELIFSPFQWVLELTLVSFLRPSHFSYSVITSLPTSIACN